MRVCTIDSDIAEAVNWLINEDTKAADVMASGRDELMTYSHLWAYCLYTGISSGPNARSVVILFI